MILLIDVGWLGSPVDVGTFIIVLAMLVFRLRPRVKTIAAAVVALAERRDDVDDDRLQSELDVEQRDVEALRPRIVKTDSTDE